MFDRYDFSLDFLNELSIDGQKKTDENGDEVDANGTKVNTGDDTESRDYTQDDPTVNPQDDNTADTPTDTNADTDDTPANDYTQDDQQDTTTDAGNDTGGTDTATTDTTPAADDQPNDYTQDDTADTTANDTTTDTPDTADAGGTDAADTGAAVDDTDDAPATDYTQDDTATDNTAGGDAGTAGGDAQGDDAQGDDNAEGDEDGDAATDYTQDDGGGDGTDTGDTEGGTDDGENENQEQTDDTAQPTSVLVNNIKDLEAQLFSNLTPEQISIKNIELKTKFIDMHELVQKVITRVDNLKKTEENLHTLDFVIKKLTELAEMINDYITRTYDTNTYIENQVNYKTFLVTLDIITKILEQVKGITKSDLERLGLDKEK